MADIMWPVPQNDNASLYGVEQIEPGAAGVQVVLDLIQGFFLKKIKRYILGQTVTSETDPEGIGGGSYQAKMATYADIIQYDARNAEETLTKDYLRPQQLRNFPKTDGAYLTLKLNTDDPKVQERLEAANSAFQMGLDIDAEDMYDITGLSKPAPSAHILNIRTLQGGGGMPGGMPGQAGSPGQIQPGAAPGEQPLEPGQPGSPDGQVEQPGAPVPGIEQSQGPAVPGAPGVERDAMDQGAVAPRKDSEIGSYFNPQHGKMRAVKALLTPRWLADVKQQIEQLKV